jgi:hypothetical protein
VRQVAAIGKHGGHQADENGGNPDGGPRRHSAMDKYRYLRRRLARRPCWPRRRATLESDMGVGTPSVYQESSKAETQIILD